VILQATIPNYARQENDEITLVGSRITIKRNGTVIYSARLDAISQPFEICGFGNQAAINTIFWEKRMPGINVALQGVIENQTSGTVRFQFSDGTENEYSAWADVSDIADQIDADSVWLKKLIIARSYRSSPGGENKTTQVGAQASANLVASEPITYTEAQ
jgi:hypothetical protein